jgi:hypothetical protein
MKLSTFAITLLLLLALSALARCANSASLNLLP